ncbi:unnamed protein product [Discosporangium mesarthrocarpum]
MYEQLIKVCPDVEEYKVYLAQSLYKGALYPEATRAAVRVDSPQYQQRVLALQSAIKYEQDDLPACKSLVDQCLPDDPDTIISYGSIAFKEGDYGDARHKYMDAMNTLGYQADLAYNIALCYYKEKQYTPALKHIGGLTKFCWSTLLWEAREGIQCTLFFPTLQKLIVLYMFLQMRSLSEESRNTLNLPWEPILMGWMFVQWATPKYCRRPVW